MNNKKYIEKKLNFYWKFMERPRRIIAGKIRKVFGIDNNPWRIQHEANKHRNELVLDTPGSVYRFLGWTRSFENEKDDIGRDIGDFYYVLQKRSFKPESSFEYRSCVMGFIFLKRRLNKFEYYQAENVWNLNCCSLELTLDQVKKQNIVLL